MTSLLLLSPFVSMPFLGHPLSSTLVYIWSRRNPDALMSFLGLLVFRAPYLPWVLMGVSFVLHGTVPRDEFMGIVIGHVWYFFNDVYPPLHGGSRPLDPPMFWRRLFGESPPGVGRLRGCANTRVQRDDRAMRRPTASITRLLLLEPRFRSQK
jgi:Derlin-2/3